ncbi:hypothetical protein BE20_39565 [Sorangium cellulosum]|nr:hypothetical protein BE20_39565 [Sorangium cellulosum]
MPVPEDPVDVALLELGLLFFLFFLLFFFFFLLLFPVKHRGQIVRRHERRAPAEALDGCGRLLRGRSGRAFRTDREEGRPEPRCQRCIALCQKVHPATRLLSSQTR